MAFRFEAGIIAVLICTGALQAETFEYPVRHRHWHDGGQGVLRIAPEGLTYQESGKQRDHGRSRKYADIQQLVLAPSEIRILTYEDVKWQLNRDREYAFDRLPEHPTDHLALFLRARLDRRFVSEIASVDSGSLWSMDVKLQRGRGGSHGMLVAGADGVLYASDQQGESRNWRYPDLENVSSSGPFELTLMTYEHAGWAHSSPREFRFQLKEAIDDRRYDDLWRRVNSSHGLQVLGSVAEARVFTGVITDSMCVANHAAMQRSPDAKCIHDCVQSDKDTKYVLFDGKNAYKLSDQETPARFVSQPVKVTGKLFQKTGIIKVDAIEALK